MTTFLLFLDFYKNNQMVYTLQWITVIVVLRPSECHYGLGDHLARILLSRAHVHPTRFSFEKNAGVSPWELVKHHPGWKILDGFDCGENVADRIIGGLNASLGQFPWIVRLGYVSGDSDETDWMCGGALITDKHVVTAAHCVQVQPQDEFQLKFVRLGEYDTQTNPDCRTTCAPPYQDRNVKLENIKSHKQFNNPAFHNDIAIIELDTPVNLNDFVVPICLPREEQLTGLKIGELLTVAGWGKMNMSTDERAKILQYVALPVVEPSVCDSFGRGFKLSESEICAGAQKNKDACGGDSGGPLMKIFDTPEGPKTFLVGIVSFGPTICGIKKPGVYASVGHFLGWILDQIV